MIKKIIMYALVTFQVLVLFPLSLQPDNDYKLLNPDAVIQPDPDTIFFLNLVLAAMVIITFLVIFLSKNSKNIERNILLIIVILALISAIASRIVQ